MILITGYVCFGSYLMYDNQLGGRLLEWTLPLVAKQCQLLQMEGNELDYCLRIMMVEMYLYLFILLLIIIQTKFLYKMLEYSEYLEAAWKPDVYDTKSWFF